MIYILSALWSILFISYVVLPVLKANRRREDIRFKINYRTFQLAALRSYYPELKDVPVDQLQLRFDIDSWYDLIGREITVEVRQKNQWSQLLNEWENSQRLC
jgi:hypothetical protein